MASLAKSTVNCTNSIIISDIKIHMDEDGRYSLNDLHTASGKEDKHQPAFFMRRNETIELINEIFNSANMQDKKPVDSKKGRYGGTYACKELVYSYAMWISAAFALKVIRAYDSMVSGELQKMEAKRYGAKTTVDERTPLRDAVNMLVSKKRLMYPEAYAMIHQRFNVESIEDLEASQIQQAIEYVHRVVIEGEFIGNMQDVIEKSPSITDKEMVHLAWLWDYANRSQALFREVLPAMKQMQSQYSGRFFDHANEFGYSIETCRRILESATAHINIDRDSIDTNPTVLTRLRANTLPARYQ